MSGRGIRLASDPAADKAGVFQAGAELREARERLGWDLGEVAAALRIKIAYLQAIEDGRISALPGNAYALGFLRTYATTLGLDPDAVSRRFRAEANDVNRRPDLAFPAPAPERGVPTGALVLIGLLIAAVGYGAWYKLSDREPVLTHTVPPVPDSLLPARHAAPISPQVASVLPPPGVAVPVLPQHSVAAPAPPPQPTPVPTGTAPAAAPPATPAVTSPATPFTAAPSASAVPAPPGLPATAVSPPAAAAAGIVLHASAVTWVQIRGADKHVVWDHVMQPGDTWTVPADTPGLTLTTGNAGGLVLSSDGKTSPVLGKNGAVLRNVSLDKQMIEAAVAGTKLPESPVVPAPRVHHAAPLPPPGSASDTADELNARQLGH